VGGFRDSIELLEEEAKEIFQLCHVLKFFFFFFFFFRDRVSKRSFSKALKEAKVFLYFFTLFIVLKLITSTS